ncbi:hypothetical protein EMCRGX_G012779 [Ephydatia muelleri]
MYNVALRHSLSDGQRKTANDNYNQHFKAKALRDTYNANIEKAEKEWKGRGQKDRDWILGCLAQLSPFISHAYLDMALVHLFTDACKEGDGERVIRCWKLCMLHFHAERKTKYALEALRLQFQFATLQPNLVHQLSGEDL